jgi:hypothetical protein
MSRLLSWHCPCNLRIRPVLYWPVVLYSLSHIHYPVFIQHSVCSVSLSVLPFCRSSDYSICSVLVRFALFDLLCSICFVRLFSIWLFAYSVIDYSIYSVLFSVLILELYSRYFDPVNTEVTCYHHQPSSKSINIIKYKTCTCFWLSIGGSKAFCIIVTSRDIRNQFLWLGSKEGETPRTDQSGNPTCFAGTYNWYIHNLIRIFHDEGDWSSQCEMCWADWPQAVCLVDFVPNTLLDFLYCTIRSYDAFLSLGLN